MSALRIARPGQPVAFLDLGPAVGRISHTRYGTQGYVGGVVVVPESTRTRDLRLQRIAQARARADKR